MRYTLRNDKIFDVDQDSSPYIRDEEGDLTSSIIGQTFTYDTRDDRFLPNTGTLFRYDQDLAGLGGDNQWFKQELRVDWYCSVVPDVVVNLGASGGYIFGFGGVRQVRKPVEPSGQVPVPVCEQLHRRGQQDRPYDDGVDQDRGCEADAELFEDHRLQGRPSRSRRW